MKNYQVWDIKSNGKTYIKDVVGSFSDIQKEYVKPDRAFYNNSCNIKAVKVGIMVKSRIIRFKDLKLNTTEDLQTMTYTMLHYVINKSLNNKDISYFMWKRELINDEYTKFTDKGKELQNLWLN